ncbi:MAG: IMP cyclohydrolase [Deltaproteobacteria bacterium]|jgi:phosphoribosylaminoimidazolecarboxamide formyltransferase/IMP cyclohydrolase|nr:IMP cyclohydrolase [Deltaproteobacteria bacterium]
MSSLKKMYTTLLKDEFPATLSLDLGGQRLVFKKRLWNLPGEGGLLEEKGLRYGENPDQPAALYELAEGNLEIGGVRLRAPNQGIVSAISEAEMIQAGKHPGKTNLTDVDSGVNILQSLTAKPAAAILKHNNPCGAAWSDAGIADALEKAFWCDRIAAFGGAVVVNSSLDKAAAELISSSYFEVVAAPEFESGVLDLLKKRKNLRIFRLPRLADLSGLAQSPFLEIKSLVDGGLILQQSFMNRIRKVEDFMPAEATEPSKLTANLPTPQQAEDLLFAWAVESGVISNSIIFAKNGATVAIGAGEQDRVGCVELAIYKAYTKYLDKLVFRASGQSLYEVRLKAQGGDAAAQKLLAAMQAETDSAKGGLLGSVMVSDGFFPFRDGVDAALCHGIKAIAQPGGSLRDHEVIAAVNENQAAMVFTGQRAFKH